MWHMTELVCLDLGWWEHPLLRAEHWETLHQLPDGVQVSAATERTRWDQKTQAEKVLFKSRAAQYIVILSSSQYQLAQYTYCQRLRHIAIATRFFVLVERKYH